jgi:hypothetical protein
MAYGFYFGTDLATFLDWFSFHGFNDWDYFFLANFFFFWFGFWGMRVHYINI